jgi:hypothetical protein
VKLYIIFFLLGFLLNSLIFALLYANERKKEGVKISWVGWINLILFQFFCIRLGKIVDKEDGHIIGYKILKWVYPFSGWFNDY